MRFLFRTICLHKCEAGSRTDSWLGPRQRICFPPCHRRSRWTGSTLNPAGIFYVDLKISGEVPFPAWGSRQEMLAVYSIVNTVLTNTPEISSVVLLRNGQQRSYSSPVTSTPVAPYSATSSSSPSADRRRAP